MISYSQRSWVCWDLLQQCSDSCRICSRIRNAMVRPGWPNHHEVPAVSLVMSLGAGDDPSTVCFSYALIMLFSPHPPSPIYLHGVRPSEWQAELTRWFIISSVILIQQIAASHLHVCRCVSRSSDTSPFQGYHFSPKIVNRHLESGLDQRGEKSDHFYEPRGRATHKIYVKLEPVLHREKRHQLMASVSLDLIQRKIYQALKA